MFLSRIATKPYSIPPESIEFHTSTYEAQSSSRGSSVSARNQEDTRLTPIWRRTPLPGFTPAPTPNPWEYLENQTPAPWPPMAALQQSSSRTPTPASRYSGSLTPTPAQQQFSSRTPTPASFSRSSVTPSWNASDTEGVDDGERMTPASWYSGSVTPTPTQQQFSSRTPTPAPFSRSSVTPSWNALEEIGGFDDGDSMEE